MYNKCYTRTSPRFSQVNCEVSESDIIRSRCLTRRCGVLDNSAVTSSLLAAGSGTHVDVHGLHILSVCLPFLLTRRFSAEPTSFKITPDRSATPGTIYLPLLTKLHIHKATIFTDHTTNSQRGLSLMYRALCAAASPDLGDEMSTSICLSLPYHNAPSHQLSEHCRCRSAGPACL
ncbi:hypothetical protein J6590_081023 [Homalodisca vitripennis]|nr:hypothetical protein J6590_081023 [Homalodisca vitripennis]